MEINMVKVTAAGITKEYRTGTVYEEIAKEHQKDFDAKIVLVLVNGKLNELHKKLTGDCTIEFKTVKDRSGYK
ncbi:MAG TPA: TGS domain-containing protein, partial [Lachnospiraceae bacterium]|nr:TGS domain-containing protein [Lachnospiraceae bacterium]